MQDFYIKNSHGDRVRVPAMHRAGLEKLIKGGCNECVDKFLEKMQSGGAAGMQDIQPIPMRQGTPGEEYVDQVHRRMLSNQGIEDLKPVDVISQGVQAFNQQGEDYVNQIKSRMAPQPALPTYQDTAMWMIGAMGAVNGHMEKRDSESEYKARMRQLGASDNKYQVHNPVNPFGNYTLNAGPGNNFQPNKHTVIQDFQRGGPVKPATRQDSLDVYNNARKVADYYKDYKLFSEAPVTKKTDVFGDLKYGRDLFEMTRRRGISVPTPDGKLEVRNDLRPSDYYKAVDENRFYQREQSIDTIDKEAPMQLFDKRIRPQKMQVFDNRRRGDTVESYMYDPIAVKPWQMLTPAERAIRVKKYGVPQQPLPPKPDAYADMNPRMSASIAPDMGAVAGFDPHMYSFAEMPPVSEPAAYQAPAQKQQRNWDFFDNNHPTVRRKRVTGLGGSNRIQKRFEEGGEYELSDEEIKMLRDQGYDLQYVD